MAQSMQGFGGPRHVWVQQPEVARGAVAQDSLRVESHCLKIGMGAVPSLSAYTLW